MTITMELFATLCLGIGFLFWPSQSGAQDFIGPQLHPYVTAILLWISHHSRSRYLDHLVSQLLQSDDKVSHQQNSKPSWFMTEKNNDSDNFLLSHRLALIAVSLHCGTDNLTALTRHGKQLPTVIRRHIETAVEGVVLGLTPYDAWHQALTQTNSGGWRKTLLSFLKTSNHKQESLRYQLDALGEIFIRTQQQGLSLAPGFQALSVELIEQHKQQSTAISEKALVKLAVPLGICFLPSFICLGLVPIIAGLTNQYFHPTG